MRKFLSILLLCLLIATSINVILTRNKLVDSAPKTSTETTESTTGTALVGGNFTLINQEGNAVTPQDFQGKVMVVFFGFTHCPDICPVTAATFAKTLTLLGEKAAQIAPLFITVDPKRDTPEVLKTYLANVDPRIIGLTGTPEHITAAVAAYKAYAAPAQADASESAEHGEEHEHHSSANHASNHHDTQEYTINHSGFVYVMDKKGVYAQHFAYNVAAEDLAAAIDALLH